MMLRNIFFVCSFLLISNLVFSQALLCSESQPACAGSGLLFANTSDGSAAQVGPDYGCLDDQPNPAWFKLKIQSDGDWNFEIAQNTQADFSGTGLDVDFICYGPFVEGSDYCNNLTAANYVDCSYSLNVIENMTISNAQADEIYILLITNYQGDAGFINFSQIGYDPNDPTTHATDCSIVNTINVCGSDTHDIDVTDADASATYSWEFDDGTGAIPIVGATSPILQVPADIDGDGNVDTLTGQYIATILISAVESTSINNVNFGTVYNPGTSTDIELCEGDVALQDLEAEIGPHDNGNGTGVWSDDDASGVVLGTATAVDFSGLAPNTYHYSYTIPANNGCPEYKATVTLTISELLLAGGVTTPIGFCETEPALQDLTAALNGADAGGTWTETSVVASGVDITAPAAVDFSLAIDGVYTFEYAFTGIGSCPDSSQTVTVTIDNIAYAGEDFDIEFCEGETTTQDLFGSLGVHPTTGESADLGGVWTDDNASGVILTDPTAVDFSGIADGIYNFTYTFAATPSCQLSDGVITVTISNLAVTGTDSGTTAFCEGEATPQDLTAALIGADLGGDWIETSAISSGTIITNPTAVDFSNVVFGIYTFEYFFDIVGSCERVSTEVVVTISEYFSPGVSSTLVLCEGDAAPQSLFNELGATAEWGGAWSDDDATLIDISDINDVDFSTLSVGDYDFTYTHPALGTCPITSATITVSINAIPNSIAQTIEICDDDNDGIGYFDLDAIANQITGGLPGFDVTFHETPEQAIDGVGDLVSPYENVDAYLQTVSIRVENQITGCYNVAETVELIVYNSPVLPTNDIVYSLCEDAGSTDGFVVFDLPSYELTNIFTEIILNGGNPSQYLPPAYYAGLDLLGNPDPATLIANPAAYQNTTSPDQIIYVSLVSNVNADSNGNGCESVKEITLHVDLLPTAQYTQIRACDDEDIDLGEVPDELFAFNLNNHIDDITNGETGVEVTFYEDIIDAEAGFGPSLITNPESFVAGPAKAIFARVYNSTTECYAVTLVELHVDPRPTPLTTAQIAANTILGIMEVCDGNVDGSGSFAEQVAEFDLTQWETTILGGEAGVSAAYYTDYDEAVNEDNPITTPATFTNTSNSQTIYVRVTNDGTGVATPGSGCYTIVSFVIMVPVPEVDILTTNDTLCVDENGMPLTGFSLPELTASVSPVAGYNYQWALNGVDISGATNQTLTVSQAGVYTVTVASQSNTQCIDFVSQTIEISGVPQEFEANAATSAFADTHQIIADATSNLDSVEFLYSLDGGAFGTSGLFDNVAPGFHNVTIKDAKGCWSTVIPVTIIDYPQFFTPNNDGYNDTWKIIGQEDIPISQIYIFDRFGKLLKQLDPDTGWDGTYNGHLLPADDYWFKIIYIEGNSAPAQKEFMAHFTLKR